jgi:hypothetical protein
LSFIFSSGLSATSPTNSPEESEAILEASIAASNCLEWLMDVSVRLMEKRYHWFDIPRKIGFYWNGFSNQPSK